MMARSSAPMSVPTNSRASSHLVLFASISKGAGFIYPAKVPGLFIGARK
jgi:hypothetical protein